MPCFSPDWVCTMQGETADKFMVRLHKQAHHCKFGAALDKRSTKWKVVPCQVEKETARNQ